MNGKVPRILVVAAAVALTPHLLIAPAVRAQDLPLEDKAKFERVLEEKVEAVLIQMLGAGQAKVVVDAAIDFTRLERWDVRSAELDAETKKQASRFLWQNLQPQEPFSQMQILPGFAVPEVALRNRAGQPLSGGNQKVERELSYPESFVKRLAVTVVLNQSIPEAKAEDVRGVIADLLGIQPPRGDSLNIVRAAFPPPWKTVWNSPESAGFVIKYASLTLMAVLALLVVGYCFLKLAGAMSAMASAQMHQVSLELPKMGLPELPRPDGAPGAEGARNGGLREEARGDALTFDVRPDQADTLVQMIGGEDAPNIALVVAHLPADSRRVFLAKLPAPVAASVLDHLSQVKFVDPEMISTLKEELERRLRGALGGLPQVLALLEQVGLKTKKELLDQLWKTNPALAREVRRKTLLMDDLIRLPAAELSLFVLSARLEDWAVSLQGAPDALRDMVKAQLPAKSWQIVEQTMAARRPNPARVQDAQERIIALAQRLIAEGRVSDPLAGLPDLLAGGADPAPGPEAG